MRQFAKYSEIKEGDVVILDSRFTCIDEGEVVIENVGGDLCFKCDIGYHFLNGQLEFNHDDNDDHLVGIYKKC